MSISYIFPVYIKVFFKIFIKMLQFFIKQSNFNKHVASLHKKRKLPLQILARAVLKEKFTVIYSD